MARMNDAATTRVQRIYDRLAERYDRSIGIMERLLFGSGRQWVCSQARGDVLEIAVGTGRNLPFYAAGVRLTGIELSPKMLALARQRAAEVGIIVDLQLGDAQALAFADESFDSVVCTLSLCSIPDDRRAVAEVARVLRPGGRFVLLEHVRSPGALMFAMQRILEPVMVRFEGDHLTRDPLGYLEASGLAVERSERSKWGIVERLTARKSTESSGRARVSAKRAMVASK